MRNILIILFLLFTFISCTSCNSSQNHDSDHDFDHDSPDLQDSDFIVYDSAVPDSDNNEIYDPDMGDDSDISDTDITGDEFIDDCDVKLIDAGFPYTDNDGNITFCRSGCDMPTEADPQCMSNLWKEQNYNLCHKYPEYDCCGYPCVLNSLKPVTKEEEEEIYGDNAIVMHKCDLKINPRFWSNDGTMGVVKSWNMSEGKVGFKLSPTSLSIETWPVKVKFVTYDIASEKYSLIAPARGQEEAYYKGKRIGLVSDTRSHELDNTNIFLAYIGDDGSYSPVYNKIVYFLAYEPALNDKWAFVNLQETETSSYKMMYAKVGDPASGSTADSWKWTELGEGFGWEPGIVGNTLVLVDDNVNGWICDLSKNPRNITECRKVNRDGEEVRGIRIDKNDERKFVYNSNITKLVHLELKDGELIYNDLIKEFTSETQKNAYSLAALEYKDNILLFEEIVSDGSSYGGLLCYYRIDKNKKYCMKKMEKDESFSDGTTKFPYGFAEFEDKWLLYQKKSSTPLILRDMDCYCKEEGICPFEENDSEETGDDDTIPDSDALVYIY